MTISATHTTQATGTDAGNGEIRKAQWNEARANYAGAGNWATPTTASLNGLGRPTPSPIAQAQQAKVAYDPNTGRLVALA